MRSFIAIICTKHSNQKGVSMLSREYSPKNIFCDDECDKDYPHSYLYCDYKYLPTLSMLHSGDMNKEVGRVDEKLNKLVDLMELVVERLYDSSYNPSDRVYTPRYKAPTPEPAPTQATIQRRGL